MAGLVEDNTKQAASTETAEEGSQASNNLIDGKKISAEIRAEVLANVKELMESQGVTPGLAVVLVGNRPDSSTYVRMKKKAAKEAQIYSRTIELADDIEQDELLKVIDELNSDNEIHGILVQLPLPAHIQEHVVLKRIKVDKDVDGFSAENIGNLCLKGGDPPLAIPCTPGGVVQLLERANVSCESKHAVVIGRSNIVGMPVSQLLLSMNCTVTTVHSRTKDIESHVRQADIVIAAVGRPQMVKASWIKPGAVVIDVGINSVPDASKKSGYRLVGDVHFDEVQKVAGLITPVPGGVGPTTVAMLLFNTVNLARHHLGLPRIHLRRKKYEEASS